MNGNRTDVVRASQPAPGGCLDLSRLLQAPAVTREDARALVPRDISSTSRRFRLTVDEVLPELPDRSPIVQASLLVAALQTVLASIDADDAAQYRRAAPLEAQRQALLDEAEGQARKRHSQEAHQRFMRGGDPLPYERPSPLASNPLRRPLEIPVGMIKKNRADPAEYLEDSDHQLLTISELRTTLAYERRDVTALMAAANERMVGDLTEIADLAESVFDVQPGHVPDRAEVGACLSAWCRLRAATSDAYARIIWARATEYWRSQIFFRDDDHEVRRS